MIQAAALGGLMAAAVQGDKQAWDTLVERYIPLVFSVIRKFRLSEADAQDVSQTVWLRLVEHLDDIREPRALPGWIATTTKNEALGTLKAKRRTSPIGPDDQWLLQQRTPDASEVDSDLISAERSQALREALAELPIEQQRFLMMFVTDPPHSYDDISRQTGMPVGSIGPTRARCLKKLRATSSMQALVGTEGDQR